MHRINYEISEAPIASGFNIASEDIVRNKVNPGGHECFGCPKVFTHKWMLDRHILTHTGEQPFACSICFRRFSLQASCLRHVRHVHKDQVEGGLLNNYVVKASELEVKNDNTNRSMQS